MKISNIKYQISNIKYQILAVSIALSTTSLAGTNYYEPKIQNCDNELAAYLKLSGLRNSSDASLQEAKITVDRCFTIFETQNVLDGGKRWERRARKFTMNSYFELAKDAYDKALIYDPTNKEYLKAFCKLLEDHTKLGTDDRCTKNSVKPQPTAAPAPVAPEPAPAGQ